MELGTVRQMWRLLEPLHAVLYYAPEARAEAAELGYRSDDPWQSYFAWRSASLGAAGPALVSAAYYSFSPRFVREYVPAIWQVASPEQVLAARLRAVDQSYRALLGERLDEPWWTEAAELARTAAEAAGTAGRPLAAANADQPWPDAPHLVVWQAALILREQRGDGHVAALLTAGLDPTEALVSFAAVDAAPVKVFASRGWTRQEWSAAQDRLVARGWVDAAGKATERGRAEREAIERRTDELAAPGWQALGAGVGRLAQLLGPTAMAVVKSGLLPATNTLGMKVPS